MDVRPAGWDDFDAVCDLLAARSRVVYGISDVRPEHVRAEWELPSFEIVRDSWVAVEAGRVSGYAAVSPGHELTHTAADPGAGDALLAAAVKRARERELATLHVIVGVSDEPLRALVERHGFELETEILRMWKTLDGSEPDPVWPDGITVRAYEPRDAGEVKQLLDDAYLAWDATYVPQAHADWVRWMTGGADFDPGLWFLAEREAGLAGCALHWRSGWVKDLAVAEPHRGRGLGAALLLHGFGAFWRRGVRRVGLKVDRANPTSAIHLYERLGFVVDRREEVRTLCL
jgi:ribosomal protein S18 acetylase RimI-like enzyme